MNSISGRPTLAITNMNAIRKATSATAVNGNAYETATSKLTPYVRNVRSMAS
ncbi:hypothetical protein [Peptoclostridium acidaminophilum]|nr:hypothetical protein [Peptoclostridium acidaminophilum]